MWFAAIILTTLISATVRAELRDPNNSADYIILTSQEVLSNNSWIDSLLDYRAAQGRVSMAVTVEEIWDEFTPAGSDTAIREFLHYAFDNWQTPQLKDVFIVGHWDVVPSGTWFDVFDSTLFATDYLFTLPLDTQNAIPMFRIGRLPWSPRFGVNLNSFFDKIRAYEASVGGEWTTRCHLFADSGTSASTPCEDWVESVARDLPDEALLERDYLNSGEGDPWHGDREEVLQHLNNGNLLTCFGGPSAGYAYLREDPITSSEILQLDNIESQTILIGSVSSALGVDTIAALPLYAAALNSTNGGAISALGLSSIGWYIASATYNRRFASDLFDSENVTVGDAWFACCSFVADSVLEGHLYHSSVTFNLLGTFLLGDPATIIPGRTTDVDPIMAPPIPKSIEIVGNYPNPFNPSTTINFMLNRSGLASLTVYDITGRAVTTLAEQNFTAGEHSIVWNAAGHASGMYLVRLESAGQFATHRVTLLK